MPTPGATSCGSTAAGRRPTARGCWTGRSRRRRRCAPTANASGLLAGLQHGARARAVVAGREHRQDARRRAGCAGRAGSRGCSRPLDIVQELLTTSGASAVAGLPSGSSSHWKPWWIAVERGDAPVVEDLDRDPPGVRRHPDRRCRRRRRRPSRPSSAVPWPFTSVGVVGCWPFGSYQLFVPPRQRPARSGWRRRRRRCPCSRRPCPGRGSRAPTASARPTRAMLSSAGAAATASGAGALTARSGRTATTSGRVASSRSTDGAARTPTSSTIHSGVTRSTRCCDCRSASSRSTPRCAVVAVSRSARSTAASRAGPGRRPDRPEVGLGPEHDHRVDHLGRRHRTGGVARGGGQREAEDRRDQDPVRRRSADHGATSSTGSAAARDPASARDPATRRPRATRRPQRDSASGAARCPRAQPVGERLRPRGRGGGRRPDRRSRRAASTSGARSGGTRTTETQAEPAERETRRPRPPERRWAPPARPTRSSGTSSRAPLRTITTAGTDRTRPPDQPAAAAYSPAATAASGTVRPETASRTPVIGAGAAGASWSARDHERGRAAAGSGRPTPTRPGPRPRRSRSAPGVPWAEGGTPGADCAAAGPTSGPGRSAQRWRRAGRQASATAARPPRRAAHRRPHGPLPHSPSSTVTLLPRWTQLPGLSKTR